MQLEELSERLVPFCQHQYRDLELAVSDVHQMPGHAGFAYGFTVESNGEVESWFLRLPPPGVRWRGTADVRRQVEVLNLLDSSSVPHCSVRWASPRVPQKDDLSWFGSPYFIVPKLSGDVLRLGEGEWGAELSDANRLLLGQDAMAALARIHNLDWHSLEYLGEAVPFEDDVQRWDRFLEKAADPGRLSGAAEVRCLLLKKIPGHARVGLFHGDFQTANLFCSVPAPEPTPEPDSGDASRDSRLRAVIDWELTGIGACLNDLGWMVTFSDPLAWDLSENPRAMFLDPETLIGLYTTAWQEIAAASSVSLELSELNWFRALAAYKFAIITGFNLALHRRAKRHDPLWEISKHSMQPLIERALSLLT